MSEVFPNGPLTMCGLRGRRGRWRVLVDRTRTRLRGNVIINGCCTCRKYHPFISLNTTVNICVIKRVASMSEYRRKDY